MGDKSCLDFLTSKTVAISDSSGHPFCVEVALISLCSYNLSSAVWTWIGCRLGGLSPYWFAAYLVLAPSESASRLQSIDRAVDPTPTPIYDVDVHYGRAHIPAPEQFLNRPDVLQCPTSPFTLIVIPGSTLDTIFLCWIPAFAGMTASEIMMSRSVRDTTLAVFQDVRDDQMEKRNNV